MMACESHRYIWRRMTEDHRRPAQYTSLRDDRLRGWLGTTVRSYSPALGPILADHGIDRPRRATLEALRALPVVPVDDLGDGHRHVLEPGVEGFGRSAALSLQVRFLLADVVGRRDDFARRHIDPRFKPVLWTQEPTMHGTRFVANTATDLDRLATLGRRAWATSGVRADDRVLLVDDGSAGTVHRQMVEGCRNAGIAVLIARIDDAAALMRTARPTVVAGPVDVVASLSSSFGPSVRSICVDVGDEPDLVLDADLPVARWWAPPAARAAWVGCPGGAGFHTWPEDELAEIVDGSLVWSAVGWHGSVWLRVDTGVLATIDDAACPSCDRTTPRVLVGDPS